MNGYQIERQNSDKIEIWNGLNNLLENKIPGLISAKHPARVYPDTLGNVIRLTDITDAVFTVYPSKSI